MIYFTDLALVPLFMVTLYAGIALHLAGHDGNHDAWHNWAVVHTIAGLLFAAFGILHVKTHWTWYKVRKANDIRSKSVWLLSFVFIGEVVTGVLLLLWVDGADSLTGLLHYKIGLIAGVLGILHILRRFRFLSKGFTENLCGDKNARN